MLVGLVAASTLQANPITNGNITLTVDNTNGAINSVIFGGAEFYRQGYYVSDYGFQLVGDASSFALLNAYGILPVGVTISSVTSASNIITVEGTYGNDISFTRTYSFVSGLDVIRTTTTLTNNGSNAVNLCYFDTFDPDQGIDANPSLFTPETKTTYLPSTGSQRRKLLKPLVVPAGP